MKIIPAIDIQNGNCVRLRQGDFSQETIFNNSPLDIAEKWVKDGAQRLHIVDLDGARLGEPINIDLISKICKTFPSIPVQIGGGIRDVETARKILMRAQALLLLEQKQLKILTLSKTYAVNFIKR